MDDYQKMIRKQQRMQVEQQKATYAYTTYIAMDKNKVNTAMQLGISRVTLDKYLKLYLKMKGV